MLTSLVSRLIVYCTRHHRAVVATGLFLGILAAVYTARNFALNSDIGALLSKSLQWRQREIAFEEAFRRYQLITVVVEAPTPELTSAANDALLKKLQGDTAHFETVADAGANRFFMDHALLYLSVADLKSALSHLKDAEPLLRDVATDPSLRGLVSMLEDVLIGVQQGKVGLDTLAPTFDQLSATAEKIAASHPGAFSWRVLFQGHPAKPSELRGFIEVRPKLDYASLEPGRAASNAIRVAARPIEEQFQARVRLTGPVALADDEFSKIKENALRNGLITGAIVLLILWFALRSVRLIVAVVVNLAVGLALTATIGLLLVGTFNVISVSFAVLFVGIGVDFAIQYAVRYRSERYRLGSLQTALASAGRRIAAPLTLAALATAAGFLSFLPTNYKGVSELGVIAGVGMLIAFATSVSLLPALIRLVDAPEEKRALQMHFLAPLDGWLMRHRIGVISATALVVVAGLPLLYWLRFDFDPMHLRDPHSEPVATYLDLASDPDSGVNSIEVLAPSLDSADSNADRLRALAEVSRVTTLASFVPSDQVEKIAAIRAAAPTFGDMFDPKNALPVPSDTEAAEALREGSERLKEAAEGEAGVGATASQRLAKVLGQLAVAPPDVRARAEEAFVAPLRQDIESLKSALSAQPVVLSSLPGTVRASWLTADGRARISVAPKAELTSTADTRRFVRAVLAVEPQATEGPVSIYEAGRTIVRAFVEAGLWAFLSIAIILWLVLRRIDDVLLTLVPLILAGVVTMELCVLIGMPLNFANIIALPLLLGVGVAFKIYYITAWREGQVHLLQTALTRAVVFSAMTTATAFGSLWFSSHPGTSSMGKLLALSLISTLAAAVLFQPILMGPPRAPAVGDDADPIKELPTADIEKENTR